MSFLDRGVSPGQGSVTGQDDSKHHDPGVGYRLIMKLAVSVGTRSVESPTGVAAQAAAIQTPEDTLKISKKAHVDIRDQVRNVDIASEELRQPPVANAHELEFSMPCLVPIKANPVTVNNVITTSAVQDTSSETQGLDLLPGLLDTKTPKEAMVLSTTQEPSESPEKSEACALVQHSAGTLSRPLSAAPAQLSGVMHAPARGSEIGREIAVMASLARNDVGSDGKPAPQRLVTRENSFVQPVLSRTASPTAPLEDYNKKWILRQVQLGHTAARNNSKLKHTLCPHLVSQQRECPETDKCLFNHNRLDDAIKVAKPLICPHWLMQDTGCIDVVTGSCTLGQCHDFVEHLTSMVQEHHLKIARQTGTAKRYDELQKRRKARGMTPLRPVGSKGFG